MEKKYFKDVDLSTSIYHRGRMEIKSGSNDCFHNALHNQGYISNTEFVEGWITVQDERFEHAWLESDGKILELTLQIDTDPIYKDIVYEADHSLTKDQVLLELKKAGQDISNMFSKVIAPVRKYSE